MTQSNKTQQFSGPYMIQDSDHMSEIRPVEQKRGHRQADQSHGESRQAGGERVSRKTSKRR